MEYLTLKYPKLVEVVTIGHSYEGQPIKMVKISNGRNKRNGSKSTVWIDAGEFRFPYYVSRRKNLLTSVEKEREEEEELREKLYRHSWCVRTLFKFSSNRSAFDLWQHESGFFIIILVAYSVDLRFKRRYILRIINVEILPRDCTHEAISSLEFISF